MLPMMMLMLICRTDASGAQRFLCLHHPLLHGPSHKLPYLQRLLVSPEATQTVNPIILSNFLNQITETSAKKGHLELGSDRDHCDPLKVQK